MKKSTTPNKITLTKSRVALIEILSRIALTVSIGIGLTVLFGIVVLSILFVALRTDGTETWALLNTVLTLVTASLSAVTGYAFGRHYPEKKGKD